jgi:Wnt-binding factor required for Wnt secretion
VLLVSLLFYDDPLTLLKGLFPFDLYHIIHSVAQSTFISMLMFFWLIVIHSISTVFIYS